MKKGSSLFPCVALHVIVQMPLSNKRALTARLLARIGAETGVRAYVGLQVPLFIESFPALRVGALKRLGSSLYKTGEYFGNFYRFIIIEKLSIEPEVHSSQYFLFFLMKAQK